MLVHVQYAAQLYWCLQARSKAMGLAKEYVAPSATLAHMTQLIMPQHANSLAITFGGQVCESIINIVLCLLSGLLCSSRS